MSNLSQVFCDAATITLESSRMRSILADLQPILDEMGSRLVTVPTDSKRVYKSISGGSLHVSAKHGLTSVSASGQFLADVRACKMLNDYLMTFQQYSHNVSSMDATVDEYTNPVDRLDSIMATAQTQPIKFTRKALVYNSKNFRSVLAPAHYDPTRKTGTLYIGARGSAEVHYKGYDKTQERHDKGQPTSLHIFRHELTITGKMGVSLKDISDPTSVFWHFMPSNILTPPAAVSPWTPGKGLFSTQPKVERISRPAGAILKRKISDLHELASIFHIADQPDSGGIEYALSLIREKYKDRKSWDIHSPNFEFAD